MSADHAQRPIATPNGHRSVPSALRLVVLIFPAVVLAHWTLLRLPYFWDEGGYYIPAALDLFRTGTVIPQSTVTNAHPPLPALLLAAWWHLFGFHIIATRLLVCVVSASALAGVFRLARKLLGPAAAWAVTLLTALYPIWFVQSSLAHADIFAAAFTLWGLAVYFDADAALTRRRLGGMALLFALGALAKETAIVTPAALAVWEFVCWCRAPSSAGSRDRLRRLAALIAPVVPLMAWYAYHRARTGFTFGNPEFLRYNATANLDAHRLVICFWHRIVHLTLHMNMFVPVLATGAILLVPALASRRGLSRASLAPICVILLGNALAFSVLGGALLTRYLLPMYPLVLLICVSEWQRRLNRWGWLAGLSALAFLTALRVDPPYAFAPEDNLTYRDMIVLHEDAIHIIDREFPAATVLTAWPAAAELQRPELGYTDREVRFDAIPNFSFSNIEKAAQTPGDFDTALLFSTKWAPPPGRLDLSRANRNNDERYFDFHTDVSPDEAARLLHGEVVWRQSFKGEWVAILRFPRTFDAALLKGRRPFYTRSQCQQ